MTEPDPSVPQQFQVEVPDEIAAGIYADFASLWHTPDVFVLDFAALKQPPYQAQDDTAGAVYVVPTRVVARVKIPPSQVFELMKALEEQLSGWEAENGRRHGEGTAGPGRDAP